MTRIQLYPAQISALVTRQQYDRLRSIEKRNDISLADVVRRVIDMGLPIVEGHYNQENQETCCADTPCPPQMRYPAESPATSP